MTATAIVTLLFTDLVGSDDLPSTIRDEAMAEFRRHHFQLLREVVTIHGGQEVKTVGDGLMVAFPSALGAIAAAIAMQRASAEQARGAPDAPRIRVGLHVGEPIEAEDDYFAKPVVVARRLCDTADGGQILASELVRSLAGNRGEHRFVEVGTVELKGLQEPMPAFEVVLGPDLDPGVDAAAARAGLVLPPRLAEAAASVFVGRSSELAELRERLQLARRGQVQLCFLAGEPGIGKTTLAAQLGKAAHEDAAVVLYGRCDEEALIPYQPFVEAISHGIAGWPPSELERLLGGTTSRDVARLLPALGWQERNDAPADPEAERYRLFQAVSALLVTLARSGPLLLVLDDLHWADRPSLLLLRHLVRRAEHAPLLVLATYRDTEVARDHPLARTIAELRPELDVTRVRLRGLEQADVASLVEASGATDLGGPALGTLYRQTGGHPLFVTEMVRAFVDDQHGWSPTTIPEGVRELISSRLSRLADQAHAILQLASVLGTEFPLEIVESVSDLGSEEFLDAFDLALESGLVADAPGRPGFYGFSHALVRETLYAELSVARRARLHQRVGEALERLAEQDAGPYLAELAHHFVQATPIAASDKAIAYARAAGERAIAVLAYEEAVRLFGMAIDVIERDSASDGRLHCDLLLAQGDAQWRAGQGRAARASMTRAAELARAQGRPRDLARAALGMAGVGVRLWWVQAGRVDEPVITRLEQALAGLAEDDIELRAEVLACLAAELYFVPDSLARRTQLSAEAVELARQAGKPRTLALVLSLRDLAVYGPDTVEELLANGSELRDLGQRLGDSELVFYAGGRRGLALLQLGDAQAAWDELDNFAAVARQLRQPSYQVVTLSCQGLQAQVQGRLADAEDLAREAFRVAAGLDDPNALAILACHLIGIRREQGRMGELVGMIRDTADYYREIPAARAALAWAYMELDQPGPTRREFETLAADDFAGLPRDFMWYSAIACLAEVAAYLGDVPRSERLLEILTPHRGRFALIGGFGCIGSVSCYLGVLSTLLKRWDEAVGYFEEALVADRRAGSEHVAARVAMHYAEMLLARDDSGDAARAHDLIDRALPVADAVGMVEVARRLRLAARRSAGEPALETASARSTTRSHAMAAMSNRARGLVGRLVRGASEEDLERRFGASLALGTLFRAMALTFQPAMAFGFTGDIRYELAHGDGRPTERWTLRVRGRRASAIPGVTPNPAVTVGMSVADFARLLIGELNPVAGVVAGRIRLDGDVVLAARLTEMFGGRAPGRAPD